MKDLSNITAIVCDCGLFAELARVLARDYNKVYYYSPWEDAFPLINDSYIGYGMEEVELVSSPFSVMDKCDLAVFPDIYFGPMQEYLVKQGIPVWGSRRGDEMEINRVQMKEWLKMKGLPVGPYEVVTGISDLRKYLKSHDNQWVKFADGRFRGHKETFKAETYDLISSALDELVCQLGPFQDKVDFVVEEQLKDRVEVGVDCYTVDGMFPDKTLFGVEVKGTSYIGMAGTWETMAPQLTDFGNAASNLLKEFNYRNFLSYELRIGKDKLSYMIDVCGRKPTPPGEGYEEWYENLGEIVWEGANGKMVQPKLKSKYLAEIIIHSDWSENHPQPLEYPKQYRNNVKLRNGVRVDGHLFTLPQKAGTLVGGVSGFGDTIKAACDMAKEIAGSVRGPGLDINLDSLDGAEEEFEKTLSIIGGK